MSTQEDDNQPVALAVVAAAVLLAVGLAVGFGIAKSKKTAPAVPEAVSAPVAEASAPAADASAPAAEASAAPAAANAADAAPLRKVDDDTPSEGAAPAAEGR